MDICTLIENVKTDKNDKPLDDIRILNIDNIKWDNRPKYSFDLKLHRLSILNWRNDTHNAAGIDQFRSNDGKHDM